MFIARDDAFSVLFSSRRPCFKYHFCRGINVWTPCNVYSVTIWRVNCFAFSNSSIFRTWNQSQWAFLFNVKFIKYLLAKKIKISLSLPSSFQFAAIRYTVKKTGRKINRCLEFLSHRQFFPSVLYKIYGRHHCLYFKSHR